MSATTLSKVFAAGALFSAPLFFSSNLLFGKVVVAEVEPWTLAFIRWSLVSLILLPFVLGDFKRNWDKLSELLPVFAILGFLAMWICGAIVYFGLSHTTATNATLLYLSSPLLIVLFEALWYGRAIVWREGLGIIIATFGVAVVLSKGDVSNVLALRFNIGDLAIIVAAISWAVYSVTLKSRRLQALSNVFLLCLLSFFGALTLLPFALVEVFAISGLPTGSDVWFNVFGIVFFSSIAAFLSYQYSVRVAGPAITGIFMYLLPVYGVGLAVLLLGEPFHAFHLIGISTILSGVVLATFPMETLKGLKRKALKST